MIQRPHRDQETASDVSPARLCLKAPAGFEQVRRICARLVDSFRNPRLKLIAPPGQPELVIEFDGCQGELALVMIALIASDLPRDTAVRFDPHCPRCDDSSTCHEPTRDLLRTCAPRLRAKIARSVERGGP